MERKKTTPRPDWEERHQRTQRLLLERIAYHEAKLREEGREPLPGDSDELLRRRIAYHEARLVEERRERARRARGSELG